MIYFKDVAAVFFSLLTSIIVFALYMIFLKGNYVDAINSFTVGLEDVIEASDVDLLVSAILLVGIMGSAMITVPFSCLQTLIKDRENRIDYDISSTPIKRYQIILSYFTSAVISAFLVTSVILTVGLWVLAKQGDLHMGGAAIAKTYGIVLLGSISSTALFLILAMFFKSSAACSAFFGILSAASGFVIGAYIPLSEFSKGVQTFCNLFPATQVTVLLRNSLLNGILDKINSDLGGMDQGAFIEGIETCFNFDVTLFDHTLDVNQIGAYIVGVLAMSLVVLMVVYQKNYKRQ